MHPDLFKEDKKKPRPILPFKRIPADHYMFGSCAKVGWRVSNETNNKAKLLITKEWLDQFLSSLPTASFLSAPTEERTTAFSIKDEKGNALEIEVRGRAGRRRVLLRYSYSGCHFNGSYRHLNDTLEQKESHHKTLTTKMQIIIDNLQDRVEEQAATLRAYLVPPTLHSDLI